MSLKRKKWRKRYKKENSKAMISRLGDFHKKGTEIEDPYYGSISSFERVYKECSEYLPLFLKHHDTKK